MKRITIIASLLCACAFLAHAETPRKKKIEEELSLVARPELAARAVELIRLAPAHEKGEVASTIVEIVSRRHPAAELSVAAAVNREISHIPAPPPDKDKGKDDKDNDGSNGKGSGNGNAGSNGNSGNANGGNSGGNGNGGNSGTTSGSTGGNGGGNGNGNSGGNGGVGLGPGPNKPGHVIEPRPITYILPNGKPRHFPPDPPRRPVEPPRPIHYNKPRPH